MPFFDQPYTLLLLSAVGISAILAIVALKNRPTLGNHAFGALMVSVAMWALLTIFEVSSYDHQTKIFSGDLKYLFIAIVPVEWFIFSLYYANRIRTLKFGRLLWLTAIPLVTVALVATNGLHHLMFQSMTSFRDGDFFLISRKFGIWFWIHTAYSYALLFMGFAFIAKSLIDAQRIYRSQVISLLIAAGAPWLFNVLFLTGAHPFPHLDLTPFAFSISGLAIMWGIIRYRLLDIVPIARDFVIQNMQDGVIVIDTHHRILDMNSAAAQLAEVRQADVIGRDVGQIISWLPEMSLFSGPQNASPPAAISVQSNGSRRFLEVDASMLRENEKLTGHLVVLRDITEAMAAQEALRRSEERFKSLSENAPVIIVILDVAGIITYVNPTWEKILGHAKEAVEGRPFTDFISDEERQRCNQIYQRLMSGKQTMAESSVQVQSESGEMHIFDFTASVNSDQEGRITGFIGIAKDTTEETRLQSQLMQSQKMEAIGTLAGGIAHDFNNILMGMQANVSLLRMEAGNDALARDKLRRIEDQIQSGASLTRQLLGYARKGQSVIRPIDIHQLIDDTLNVVQRANKKIRIHRHLEAQPPILNADQGQMEVVLLNLFINAVDAMPNNGELTVATRRVLGEEFKEQWGELSPGPYIEIRVADTGMGMDENTLERIFEPFFTTKEIGRGTGLGLASVYGVVKSHRGHIRVASGVGEGATFLLLFPAADNELPKPREKTPVPLIGSNGRNVLVVDDEAVILEYVGELVEGLGFKALLSASGQEAIRIYESRSDVIDVVILDMIMPEMDGYEVFTALCALNPNLRVIIASGSEMDDRSKKILDQGRHYFLKKPFTLDEMVSAFACVLGQPPTCAAPEKSMVQGDHPTPH